MISFCSRRGLRVGGSSGRGRGGHGTKVPLFCKLHDHNTNVQDMYM
jgi:hypothetical protein